MVAIRSQAFIESDSSAWQILDESKRIRIIDVFFMRAPYFVLRITLEFRVAMLSEA